MISPLDFKTSIIRKSQMLMGLLLLVPVLLLSGCGGDANSVVGTVTLDGAPLSEALVQFTPLNDPDARMAMGSTDAEGNYKLRTSRTITDVSPRGGETESWQSHVVASLADKQKLVNRGL